MAKMSQRKFRKDLEATAKATEEVAKSSAATRASEAKASSDEFKKEMAAKPATARKVAPASSGSFGSAFASARKAGDKTFTWKGKSYTTELASEKKAAPKAAAPVKAAPAKAAPAKPTAQPAAKVAGAPAALARKTDAPKPAPGSALMRQPGRTYPGVRVNDRGPTFEAKKAAKLAELKKSADAPGASSYAKDRYRYAKETGMVQFAKGGTTGPSTTTPTTSAAAKQRKEFEAEMMRRNKAGQDAGKRAATKNLDYKAEGGKGMKKYAKGGSVDGCATKGKTKGKMVKMARGGMAMQRGQRNEFGGAAYAKGGSIDGCAVKGKTRCKGMK